MINSKNVSVFGARRCLSYQVYGLTRVQGLALTTQASDSDGKWRSRRPRPWAGWGK